MDEALEEFNAKQDEINGTHFELCRKLHDEMDNIPKNVQTKIWDLVYKHFEP